MSSSRGTNTLLHIPASTSTTPLTSTKNSSTPCSTPSKHVTDTSKEHVNTLQARHRRLRLQRRTHSRFLHDLRRWHTTINPATLHTTGTSTSLSKDWMTQRCTATAEPHSFLHHLHHATPRALQLRKRQRAHQQPCPRTARRHTAATPAPSPPHHPGTHFGAPGRRPGQELMLVASSLCTAQTPSTRHTNTGASRAQSASASLLAASSLHQPSPPQEPPRHVKRDSLVVEWILYSQRIIIVRSADLSDFFR